jgi:hypothetical protein
MPQLLLLGNSILGSFGSLERGKGSLLVATI